MWLFTKSEKKNKIKYKTEKNPGKVPASVYLFNKKKNKNKTKQKFIFPMGLKKTYPNISFCSIQTRALLL